MLSLVIILSSFELLIGTVYLVTLLMNKWFLNKYGEIAKEEWLRTENLRDDVRLDEFVVMPNHVHGIIIITYQNDSRGVLQYPPCVSITIK